MPAPPAPIYVPAPPNGYPPKYLVLATPRQDLQEFVYFDRLEIGRLDGTPQIAPGLLIVQDPTVSRRHCVLTQTRDGRCLVRDISRNGTRVDGRRLVPNLEHAIQVGQTIAVSADYEFLLAGDRAGRVADRAGGTIGLPGTTLATVLVGDIRDYTGLVQRTPTIQLQQSVSRVFETVTAAIASYGGTVKEFPGDAVVAFWEVNLAGDQVREACRAAIALDQLVRTMAADRTIWQVADVPLRMDWALATGTAAIDSFGGTKRAGLSLVGEPIVLAHRLEKLATDDTGSILVCPTTKALARGTWDFRDLGEMSAKGFDRLQHVYALQPRSEDYLATVAVERYAE